MTSAKKGYIIYIYISATHVGSTGDVYIDKSISSGNMIGIADWAYADVRSLCASATLYIYFAEDCMGTIDFCIADDGYEGFKQEIPAILDSFIIK